MQLNNSLITKILSLVFLLLGLQSLLPFRLKPIGIIIGVLVAIIIFAKNKKVCLSRLLLINSLIFFIYIISLFNSENTVYVWKYLETSLPFLAFPVFYYLISGLNFTKINFTKISNIFYRTYFLATIMYSIIVIAYFFHLGCFMGKASYNLCLSYIRVYVWGFYGHPIYVSIFIMLAIIFSVYLFKNKLLNKTILIIGIFILFGLLFFLSRKAVIVSGIISLIYYLFNIINNKKLKTNILIVITIIFASGIFIFPNTTKRFKELFNSKTYFGKPDKENSTQLRLIIYKCSLNQISQAGFFGFGLGDVQDKLNGCYLQKNPAMLDGHGYYNTHNVYLNFILATGFFGFSFFLFFLYTLYKTAIKSKNRLFVSILIFFTLIFLTENVISRQNGVIIFSFLINFYTFKFLIDSENLCKSKKK